MKVQSIQCDVCKKLFSDNSNDIFTFSGDVSKNGVVCIKAGDICRACAQNQFNMNVHDFLKRGDINPLVPDVTRGPFQPFEQPNRPKTIDGISVQPYGGSIMWMSSKSNGEW